MSRVPTALLAAVTLVVAFAVAQGSGVRALGAVVLVAGAGWCAVRSRRAGWLRVAGVLVVGLVCFVGAHVLSGGIGPWPAVVLVAAVLAAVTYTLVDAPGGGRLIGPRGGRPAGAGPR